MLQRRRREMPQITLPDGSSRSFDQAVTVADVASAIGPGLAKAALAGKINGALLGFLACGHQHLKNC